MLSFLSLLNKDIVVFYDGRNDIPVTHRVVEHQTEDSQLITKGDANESNDIAPIPYQNIIGKVVLHLPVLGRLLALFGSFIGKAAALAFILGGFLLGLGGFTVLVEFFEHLTFGTPMFVWSLYCVCAFGALGLFLLITSFVPPLRAWIRKRFFF